MWRANLVLACLRLRMMQIERRGVVKLIGAIVLYSLVAVGAAFGANERWADKCGKSAPILRVIAAGLFWPVTAGARISNPDAPLHCPD